MTLTSPHPRPPPNYTDEVINSWYMGENIRKSSNRPGKLFYWGRVSGQNSLSIYNV